jgi:hypothetical protein
MGSNTLQYGLQVWRQGTAVTVHATQRPPPGRITNPFFVLIEQDVIVFRGFFDDKPQIYGLNLTIDSDFLPLTPTDFAASGNSVDFVGPTALPSQTVSLIYIAYDSPGPRFKQCIVSASLLPVCGNVAALSLNVTTDFKAIVAVGNVPYIFFNNTMLETVTNTMSDVPGLAHVYHGAFLYVWGVAWPFLIAFFP